MTIDIIHDDPDVTIDVHPAQRLVRLTWKRSVAGPEYRALLLRLLDVVKDLDLKLWLSDRSSIHAHHHLCWPQEAINLLAAVW
jgi:hypothetical protein